MVSILAYNFLASEDSGLKIDFYAHLKLNRGLPWKKQHSTRRSIFSPAN
jgi:hypothetical protein